MRSFVFACLLAVSLPCLALADTAEKKLAAVKSIDANKKVADRSSDSKPKRDASLHIGSGYHGPSYKYLPPSLGADVYHSYASGHQGSYASSGGHHHLHGSHGFPGHSGLGHFSKHSGHSSHSGLGGGVKFTGVTHGFAGSSAPSYSGGHSFTSSLGNHGYTLGSGSHHAHSGGHSFALGHGSSGHGSSGHGYAAGHGGVSTSSSSLGPTFTSGHSSHGHGGQSFLSSGSLGGSGGGHKVFATSSVPSFSINAGHVGSAAGFATGYQFAKGISSSAPGPVSGASYGSHGFGSSQGFSGNEIHHTDHVHNGNQEHHYVVSASAGGLGQSDSHSSTAGDDYHYEGPASTYLTPSTQHQAAPSTSYGVPLATVGGSYSPKFHAQGTIEDSPVYAAGHKGLGHFTYTASKPSVLHTSFVDSSFKTPTFSNAPFKPSTFLGSKFEGSSSAAMHSPSAQYLPPSGVGAESTGYDYPVPSGPSLVGFQSTSDSGATPIHEPESTYLPPNGLEASFNDIASNPSANYLPPPGSSYGVPH